MQQRRVRALLDQFLQHGPGREQFRGHVQFAGGFAGDGHQFLDFGLLRDALFAAERRRFRRRPVCGLLHDGPEFVPHAARHGAADALIEAVPSTGRRARQIDQHVVRGDARPGSVEASGRQFPPAGQRLQDMQPPSEQVAFRHADAPPSFVRVRNPGSRRQRLRHVFLQPAQLAATFQFVRQMPVNGGKMHDVQHGVFELGRRQGPAVPAAAGLRFVQRNAQLPFHHGGVADLEAAPQQPPCDLGVEDVARDQVEVVVQDFHVLQAGVQHADAGGIAQPCGQARQVQAGAGINQRMARAVRDLHQAQDRVVGGGAQELGVQGQPRRWRGGGKEVLQCVLPVDPCVVGKA